MSTILNEQTSQALIANQKRSIDRGVRTLVADLEHENTATSTPVTRFQKVLKIYRSIKPILGVLGALPIIPATWRGVIVIFNQALEELSGDAGEITAAFKAGRDL